MRRQTLEQEAADKREAARQSLEIATNAALIAEFWKSPAGRVIEGRLTREVEAWQQVTSWGPIDADLAREQGKALRSRELLRYFNGAEESAEHHRAEAERLSKILETAADEGRITRA